MQGDSYESKGAFSLGTVDVHVNEIKHRRKVMALLLHPGNGVADRMTGVWMRLGPEGPKDAPLIREYMSECCPFSMGAGSYGSPYTPEEVQFLRTRLLLDGDGKFKRMSYDEYLHHCYWGYRKIAGTKAKLPSAVKKQGGQSMFARTFVVVPRDGVPLATAFLSSMDS